MRKASPIAFTNRMRAILMGWLIRRLVCMDPYQVYKAPSSAFGQFAFLEELVIDGHSDIDFGRTTAHPGNPVLAAHGDEPETQIETAPAHHHDGHAQPEPAPSRMSYRRMKVKFPPTLRTLEVYNSHVPDIYLIHKVIDECPELRSLTLARCTLFTRANCEFWKRLQRSESDSYFSNQEVEAYAVRIFATGI
jgi:hypothetical protein